MLDLEPQSKAGTVLVSKGCCRDIDSSLVTYCTYCKCKVVSMHDMKTYGRSGLIVPCILNPDTRWGVSGQLHAMATLNLGKSPATH